MDVRVVKATNAALDQIMAEPIDDGSERVVEEAVALDAFTVVVCITVTWRGTPKGAQNTKRRWDCSNAI